MKQNEESALIDHAKVEKNDGTVVWKIKQRRKIEKLKIKSRRKAEIELTYKTRSFVEHSIRVSFRKNTFSRWANGGPKKKTTT